MILRAAVVLAVLLSASSARAAFIELGSPSVEERGAQSSYTLGEDRVAFSAATTTDPSYVVPGTDVFNPVSQFSIAFVVSEASMGSVLGTSTWDVDQSYAWFDIYYEGDGTVVGNKRAGHVLTTDRGQGADIAAGPFALLAELRPGSYLLFSSAQSLSPESPASIAFEFRVTPIPEPSSIVLGLIGGGLVGYAVLRHLRRSIAARPQ